MVLSHLCQGFGAPEQCTEAEEEAKAANYLVTEIDRPARARRWRLMSTPPIFLKLASLFGELIGVMKYFWSSKNVEGVFWFGERVASPE